VQLIKKLHLGIPVILLALQVVFLLPTLVEILMEPPQGEEVLLCILLFVLTIASLFSFSLWKSPRSVNKSRPIYMVLVVFLVLHAMLTTAFTFGSWFLLVVTFFTFYIWIRKTLNRTLSLYRSVLLFSVYQVLVQIFVISQLNP